ncbi:MAG: hypothetical protein IRZ32_00195 [Solirubrobacteraceae bacterium]|nr:hypothetical protein [Solirubrobacteraceae bacterium]
MRTAILVGALAMIAILGGLTIAVAVRSGPDPLTVLSLLVLALLGVGVLGALREPPPPS